MADEWLHEVVPLISHSDTVTSVVRLDEGEINETFRVTLASTTELVIRRCPEHVAKWHTTVEGQAAAIELAREVGVPVPEVVYAAGRVLAYRFVPGSSLTPSTTTPALAHEAGRVHGLLYSVVGDGLSPVQAEGRSPRWTADVVFREVTTWAERLLAAPDLGPISAQDVAAAAELLQTPPAPQRRLLHGDASPGNTVTSAGSVVALIDFDDAWFGDPAGDMAWWWWNDPATSTHFDSGCAETHALQEPRTVWLHRLRLLLGLANTFAFTHPLRANKVGRLLPVAVNRAREALGSEG